MTLKRIALVLTLLQPLMNTAASAAPYNVIQAKVLVVEGTYSPNSITFIADTAGGVCASGTAMVFLPQGSNDAQKTASASAVMATLLSAKLTGTNISFGGDDALCHVNYVQSR